MCISNTTTTLDPAVLAQGITTQSALQLSSAIRHSTQRTSTYISGLDELTQAKPLCRGDVVEVQGVTGSGKTALLLFLASTAILPSIVNGLFVGGKEQTVCWLDCTSRLDIQRLATLCRTHLVSRLGETNSSLIDKLVIQSLERFIVFSPQSTLELANTIEALPAWFQAQRALPEIGYVLIDGMSEFAWADQFRSEQIKTAAAATASELTPSRVPTGPSPAETLRQLVHAIAHVRTTLAPLIFITQWVFRPTRTTGHSSHDKNLPFYEHHLRAPWPDIVKRVGPSPSALAEDPLAAPSIIQGKPGFHFAYHITCHPPPISLLPKHVSLKTALMQRKADQASEEGTQGLVAVVRAAGGREMGSFIWEILPAAVIA